MDEKTALLINSLSLHDRHKWELISGGMYRLIPIIHVPMGHHPADYFYKVKMEVDADVEQS